MFFRWQSATNMLWMTDDARRQTPKLQSRCKFRDINRAGNKCSSGLSVGPPLGIPGGSTSSAGRGNRAMSFLGGRLASLAAFVFLIWGVRA